LRPGGQDRITRGSGRPARPWPGAEALPGVKALSFCRGCVRAPQAAVGARHRLAEVRDHDRLTLPCFAQALKLLWRPGTGWVHHDRLPRTPGPAHSPPPRPSGFPALAENVAGATRSVPAGPGRVRGTLPSRSIYPAGGPREPADVRCRAARIPVPCTLV